MVCRSGLISTNTFPVQTASTVKSDDLSHILNHLGEDREAGFNAVVPPIAQSGNFTVKETAIVSLGVQTCSRSLLHPSRIVPDKAFPITGAA